MEKPLKSHSVQKNDRLEKLAAIQHPRIIAAYGGEYLDPKLEHMIAKIMANLTAVSENHESNYRITILNSPSINAFALPGGYLYITRGILALANDSAEIAAVLAHEIGHITANHGLTRQKLESEEQVAEKVVSDLLNESSLAKAAAIHGKLRLAQFSRNQELEADAIGIKSIGQAGYDTYAAERFLKSMQAYSKLHILSETHNTSPDFLATHPNTPQRIELAKHHAKVFSTFKQGIRERDSFLNGINGLIFGNTPENGYIHNGMFFHPHSGIIFEFPTQFTIDNTTQTITASGPEDLAIRFDCVTLNKNIPLEEYLESGWVIGLDTETIGKKEINGHDAVTAKAHAEKWNFDITLIRQNNTVCRLLTAAPLQSIASMHTITQSLRKNLRFLKNPEKIKPKPLRIRIMIIKAGDTIESLSKKMTGIKEKKELFSILNALSPDDILTPGEKVKIVSY